MYTHRPLLNEEEDRKAADRRTAGLMGIAITLLLLVVGLFLIHRLHASAVIEDCLLSGRRDCDALIAPPD